MREVYPMSERVATVALCKCKETKKMYGVRFEKISARHWKYTWAFPMKEASAKREGYDDTMIEGTIEPDIDYPGCPYCGMKYFVVCQCGKLNCYLGPTGVFTCEWCGLTGTITGYDGSGVRSGGDRS
jgi:hypothetical protein